MSIQDEFDKEPEYVDTLCHSCQNIYEYGSWQFVLRYGCPNAECSYYPPLNKGDKEY